MRHLHKHNEAGRKGKPRHSDVGQEVESGSMAGSRSNGRKRRVGDEHAMGRTEAPTDIKCVAKGTYAMYVIAEYNISASKV